MHEFSTMQSVVNAVLEEAKKYNAREINKIVLQIGELTFLGKEQMKFAFEVLKKNTIMKNAELIIEEVKAKVKCNYCGYEGGIEYGLKEEFHLLFPILKCPKCGKDVEILKGRECLIKSVEMDIENVTVKE